MPLDTTQTAPVDAGTPAPEPAPATESAAQPGGQPAPGGQTLATSEPTEGTGTAPAAFPENWREIMAGDDQKALSYFRRYNNPVNVGKALLGLRSKMDAGEIVRSKPEGDEKDPKFVEALNEWRAQAGVPEAPEGYLEKVPDGLVIGEDDKPHVESFIKDMHGADAPPSYVHKALQWYAQVKEQNAQARAEADKTHRAKAEDHLRTEWGHEYRSNINGIRSMFATYGNEALLDRFFSARMSDGTPLGDDPDTLKFLAAMDRQVNPYGAVPPPESAPGKALTSEKDQIRKMMADNNSDYYRGPRDATGETAMQRRYREIIEMEQKRK